MLHSREKNNIFTNVCIVFQSCETPQICVGIALFASTTFESISISKGPNSKLGFEQSNFQCCFLF